MTSDERESALQAVRLMRRAILLSLQGKHRHAAGQIACAHGVLVLAGYRGRLSC